MRRIKKLLGKARNSELLKWRTSTQATDNAISTPIFIISYNRAEYLRRSLESYLQLENVDIVIHDNGSDDTETLSYLKSLERDGVTVNRYGKIKNKEDLNNVNLSIDQYFSTHKKTDYVVTDSDIELLPGAQDTLKVYKHFLNKFDKAESIGPMLRIDDITRENPLYNEIINRHVMQFWKNKPEIEMMENVPIALQWAKIDTTFSLHRAGSRFKRLTNGIRLYGKYSARHLDWYEKDFSNNGYYLNASTIISHWGKKEFHESHKNAELKYSTYYDVEYGDTTMKVVKKTITPDTIEARHQKSRVNKPINLYWFRRKSIHEKNFGDELSAEIVEKLSGRSVRRAVREDCDMVAVGSVLKPILERKNKNKVVIWGTGLMFDDKVPYSQDIHDIRLVRGKLTASNIGLKESATYGDPALLASLFYKPSINKKKISIVPHYVDQNSPHLNRHSRNDEVKIINVFDSPQHVISEIASSELVISSSLHGIIVAHSYGVPAYWVELSNDVAGEGFKFRDYYSVFDKIPLKITLQQFINITSEADDLIETHSVISDISEIQNKIASTFPYDI